MATCGSRVFRLKLKTFVTLSSLNFYIEHPRYFVLAIPSQPKYTAAINSQVELSLESEEIKHKHHQGIRNIGFVSLPERLQKAVNNVLLKYSSRQLQDDALKLANYLKCRQLPVDERELRMKSAQLEKEITAEENINLSNLDDEKRKNVQISIRNKALNRLYKSTYHWKPMNYNTYHGILYLVGRLSPNYATLLRVFMEIRKHDPAFTPKTVFDFGSGVGSTIWSSNSVWSKSIMEYYCVDASGDMNALSQLLLQDGKEDENMFLKGVFFRHFLPSSSILKYDLVVCAYSLLELPSAESRLQVIDNLWQKTQDIMVIIEIGSNAGYSTVLEARDYILQLGMSSCDGENDGAAYVVAPCPHEHFCPRFADGSKTPCNFEVGYHVLCTNTKKMKTAKERFSYAVLRKGKRPAGEEAWPRIVRPVLYRTEHVICRMCCNDGELHEVIFTKSKQGRHLYKCARSSMWGDLLPAKVFSCDTTSDVKESNEVPLDIVEAKSPSQ